MKGGFFIGPQIRKAMSDPFFENSMNLLEKQAWQSFKNILENFLGNKRTPYYKHILHNWLEHLKTWAAT
ncbi:hypothetical protein Cfor_08157 [Coptotermes formosanus]|jgi:hypothetical protein|uniref:Uncharacterized protein n=1 Tax=Coptotermes formosanus TaxID=36987 RepID=A0A6L2PNJ5_COPFO|nr:hypothetical protein Cfor_08157 [Coptotermes formosanus]